MRNLMKQREYAVKMVRDECRANQHKRSMSSKSEFGFMIVTYLIRYGWSSRVKGLL